MALGSITKTHLLDQAFDCPDRGFEAEPVPEGTTCAITGEPLSEGAKADSLLTRASSAPHEIFPNYTSDYVSVEAARCYKHFRGGLTGNLLATCDPVAGHKPMVSTSSADKKDRPNWQRVLYGTDPHAVLEEGLRCLAIFTEEFQRRLWLDARVSVVGPYWHPYIYSGSVVRTLTVDLALLRKTLALCEYVYSLGFTKENLLSSLYGSTKKALCFTLGLPRVQTLDAALEEHRGSDELLLSAFCCQRASFDLTDPFPEQLGALEAPERFHCLIPKTTSRSRSKKAPQTSSSARPTPPPKKKSPETGQMGLFT